MSSNNADGSGSPNKEVEGGGNGSGDGEKSIHLMNETDKTSEAYLNELLSKIALVKQKVAEKDEEIAKQEEFNRAMRGRIATIKQKTEELGIDNLKATLERGKLHVEQAKRKLDDLSVEMLQKSRGMVTAISSATTEIDELRLQYMSPSTVKELIQKEEEQIRELQERNNEVQAMTESTKESTSNAEQVLQTFQNGKHLLEYFRQETELTNEKIEQAKIQAAATKEACEKGRNG